MKTLTNQVIKNSRTLSGMQKRRNSSIVTIVGEEHNAQGSTVYFSVSPDMAIVSEFRFKFVTTSAFSNVILDGSLSLGWAGSSGVTPDNGPDNFYDLLAALNGRGYNPFNGGVHTLTFTGGGTIKALLYAKYSARNR